MATKKQVFGKIGRVLTGEQIHGKIETYNFSWITQDMQKWKRAITAAKSKTNPFRRQLMELYDNIVIDGHLESVVERRSISITNRKLQFYKKGTKETDESVRENICETPWMYDFMSAAVRSVPYGFSLIEFVPEKGEISKVVDLPRANVIPEENKLLWNIHNRQDGINYLEDREGDYLQFVGKAENLGKLFTAAQYVIFKRGGFADWAQFVELYGMPIREVRYDQFDQGARQAIRTEMEKMGGNPHLVLPRTAELILHDTNASGKSEVFRELIEMSNQEMSKIFLGGTLTSDAGERGARSLGEVHQEVANEIALSDMISLEYLLNWEVGDKLRDLGVPIPEGHFKFPEAELPLEERIKIDKEIDKTMTLSEEYWIKTYGVEKGEHKKADTTGEKAPNVQAITNLYEEACEDCQDDHYHVEASFDVFRDIWERLIRSIYRGGRLIVDEDLLRETARELTAGLTKGVASFPDATDELTERLTKNVQVFSGFKTYTQLRHATDLLRDENNKLKPFQQFRNEVLGMNETYNKHYLAVEYNHALASSQMAAKFEHLQSLDNAKYLTYHTALDERVRMKHRPLEGIVRPINDSFWNTYYPPNGWGCRCNVVESIKGKKTDLRKVQKPEIGEMFAHNVAKSGVVFPEKHPYFETSIAMGNEIKRRVTNVFKKKDA